MYKIFKITVLLNGDIVRIHYYKTKLSEYASNFRSNVENYLDRIYEGVEYVILKTANTGVSYLELKFLCLYREGQIHRATASTDELKSYTSQLSKLRDILDEVGNYSKVTKQDVDYKMGRLFND